jgi:hypothetical protein
MDLFFTYSRVQLLKLPYKLLLRLPEWLSFAQEFRRTVLHKCQQCLRTDVITDVHHGNGYRHLSKKILPWEYSFSELELLCRSCHSDRHPNKPKKKSVLIAELRAEIAELKARCQLEEDYFEIEARLQEKTIELSSVEYRLSDLLAFERTREDLGDSQFKTGISRRPVKIGKIALENEGRVKKTRMALSIFGGRAVKDSDGK